MPTARPSTRLCLVFMPARPPASLCLLCMPVDLCLLFISAGLHPLHLRRSLPRLHAYPAARLPLPPLHNPSLCFLCMPASLCLLFTFASLCLVFTLAGLCLLCKLATSASFASPQPLPPLQARRPRSASSSCLPLLPRLPPLPIERFFIIIFFQSGDTFFFILSGLLCPLPLLYLSFSAAASMEIYNCLHCHGGGKLSAIGEWCLLPVMVDAIFFLPSGRVVLAAGKWCLLAAGYGGRHLLPPVRACGASCRRVASDG